MVLLAHLLKLKIQGDAPETMTGSWYDSINEHRSEFKKAYEILHLSIPICQQQFPQSIQRLASWQLEMEKS